ncbi:MAG: YggT family protein [Pseudomonadota bacterium]
MANLIGFIAFVFYHLLGVLQIAIIAGVIMSWLLAFGVVNQHNDFARTIWNTLQAITEPFLAPIRRFLPSVGGLDLSPLILLILIWGVRGYFLGPLLDGRF